MSNNAGVTIVGNVVRDPELFELPNGTAKVQFSVASERRFQKEGIWEGETSFFNVVVWRDQARDTMRVVRKGVPVIVTGNLQQRTWENPEGEKKSIVEVTADSVAIQVRGIDSYKPTVREQRATAVADQEKAPW
jgi:single-strand DNA-binding protein